MAQFQPFWVSLATSAHPTIAIHWQVVFSHLRNVVENKRQKKGEHQTVIFWKESLSVCFCQVAFTPYIQCLHLQISVTIYKMAYPIQFIYIYPYLYLWCKFRWGPFLPHISVEICTRLGMLTVDVVLSAQLLLQQPGFHHSFWEHLNKEKIIL